MKKEAYYSISSVGAPEVDLAKLIRISEMLQTNFINSFKGVRIKVDDYLVGNDYYCAVSPELYKQLMESQTELIKNP